MHRVEWFDIVRNDANEFGHDGFDARRVPGHIGSAHQDAIEAFVIRADTQPLPCSPLGTCCIQSLEAVVTVTMHQVHDPGLDLSLDSLEHDPVRRTIPKACAELYWGKRLSCVVVDLEHATATLVQELLTDAWALKAPKKLLKEVGDA